MIKQYFNISLVLFSAWTVYSYCQNDTFLPGSAAIIIIGSLLTRIKTGHKHYALFSHIPLSVIIVTSFIAGFAWRSVYLPLEDSVSPFPLVTAALQSGTIFASLIIWLKPFTKKNLYHIYFLAWLTVALSINVPFTNSILLIFCSFCIIATAIVILHTMQKPKEKKYVLRYYRDFTLFSILLVMLTTGLFYGISKTIVIFDQVFMNLVSDYILPRNYTNFLRIDPIMRLGSPGSSAWDKRPVLEINAPEIEGFYLKTQIFEDFDNGIWLEQKNIEKSPLPDTLVPHMINGHMTMFTSFEKIIPSPTGVSAAKANIIFTKSKDNILYTENEQRTRMLKFSMSLDAPSIQLTADERRRNTAIPGDIAYTLKRISSLLIGSETDNTIKAEILQEFFLNNFRYSLNVNYVADNKGLIRMILEKRPAYCTYFATAMTMLLRAQGIPARVATGFLVDEKINERSNKLLARVYDAHAWVEVFLRDINPNTGLERTRWQIMDPTPAGERNAAIKSSMINFSKIAENMWLTMMRFSAYIENLDKEKLKNNSLILLVLVIFLINSKKFAKWVSYFFVFFIKRSSSRKKKSNPVISIYHRYEHYLKSAFGETRELSDTDNEVIQRLKKRSQIPEETLAKLKSFLYQYHAARFGLRENINLENIIGEIEKDAAVQKAE